MLSVPHIGLSSNISKLTSISISWHYLLVGKQKSVRLLILVVLFGSWIFYDSSCNFIIPQNIIYLFIPSSIFSDYNIFPLYISMLLQVVRISKMHFFLNSSLASKIFLDIIIWESNFPYSQSQCLSQTLSLSPLTPSLSGWFLFTFQTLGEINVPFLGKLATNPRTSLGPPVIHSFQYCNFMSNFTIPNKYQFI